MVVQTIRDDAQGASPNDGDGRLPMVNLARPGSTRVLITDSVHPAGIDRLQGAGLNVHYAPGLPAEVLPTKIRDAHVLVVRSGTRVTSDVIDAAPRLEVIGRAGVGTDNIDVTTARRRGIKIITSPQGNILAVAEHTLALLFAVARHVPQADASLRRGEWSRQRFEGVQLSGKVLGVVGLGRVGFEVARRAALLGMRVVAADPLVVPARLGAIPAAPMSLESLFRRSDFITLHLPLERSTRNLIDARLLAMAKPGARLVNTARGGVVDEAALYGALRDGPLAAAACDVFATEPPGGSPLLALDNFIATPHIAGSTAESQRAVAVDIADQIIAIFSDSPSAVASAPMRERA